LITAETSVIPIIAQDGNVTYQEVVPQSAILYQFSSITPKEEVQIKQAETSIDPRANDKKERNISPK